MPDPTPTTARKVPEGMPRAVSFKERARERVRLAHWREAAQMSGIVFVLSLGMGTIAWSWYLGDGTIWQFVGPSRGGRATEGREALKERVLAPGMKRRAIDGVAVPETAKDVERYYAVAIDDITAARPQAGMTKASVVYEAPVEGGLTRWLAVFPDTAEVDRIGPVRSARPYFIDWAREYDALYVHVGGSPEALEKISATDMRDLNEFSASKYYVRDPKRRAPHNTYVSMDSIRAADAVRYGERAVPTLRAWKFKADADPEERPASQRVVVRYDHPNVDATWTYDPKENEYSRAQGASSVDELGATVRAKNVVVQFTEIATIDPVGRQRVRTIGSGEAIVIQDGGSFAAEWRKPSATARTVYYDGSGNEVRLNAGVTWIQIAPNGATIDIEP